MKGDFIMGSMRRNMPSKQQINVPNVGKYEHKSTPIVENHNNEYFKQFVGGKGGRRRMKKK